MNVRIRHDQYNTQLLTLIPGQYHDQRKSVDRKEYDPVMIACIIANFRHLLKHPEELEGRCDLRNLLTENRGMAIELVEHWSFSRIAIAIIVPVLGTLIFAIVYSVVRDDTSTGFTIASM